MKGNRNWLVVLSTHLKNISQIGFIFPGRGEHKKYWKPPPRKECEEISLRRPKSYNQLIGPPKTNELRLEKGVNPSKLELRVIGSEQNLGLEQFRSCPPLPVIVTTSIITIITIVKLLTRLFSGITR